MSELDSHNYLIYIMSYNSKDRTSYVYSTLKSQKANVKVLENSSSEDLMFKSEDTIDLGRENIGVGGFYDYLLNNINQKINFYGIFNNDITDISDNFIEEHVKNFSENIGIIHSNLNDIIFVNSQISFIKDADSNTYNFIENVIPFYSYALLHEYHRLLSKPIKQHYYGLVDRLLSNISNEMNLNNIILKKCIATHERSGVRKSIDGNYQDYMSNQAKAFSYFIEQNPKLIKYL